MDDQTWEEVLGSMTVAEPAAATGSDDAVPAPEETAPLADDAPPDLTDSAPEPAVSAAPAAEPEPDAQPEPAFDWREHPEAKATLEQLEADRAEAAAMRQLRAQMAEAQRIQRAQQFQRQLTELADGDMERMQQITGLLAQATTPLQQQFHETSAQYQGLQKSASALLVALQHVLPDDKRSEVMQEFEALMAVEGVDAMENLAKGKRQTIQRYETEISAKDARIAELERQLAAKAELAARAATGADVVDAGAGVSADTDLRTRLAQAPDFDTYWAELFRAA